MFDYPEIILASASPRRAELLEQIGVRYIVKVADIDESCLANETPEDLVQRLAIEKSQCFAQQYASTPIMGADTLGVLDGELLLKPRDYEHAHDMLTRMSGQWHEILSAVAISYAGRTTHRLSRNRVLFKPLSSRDIKAYWETQEPQDKAGAYAIQGLAATFIERIEGSFSGIMGLPLCETAELLQAITATIENS